LVFKLYGLSNQDQEAELSKLMKQSKEWPEPEPLSRLKVPVLEYFITANIPNYIFDSGTGLIKAENFPNSAKK
jgi:hypothetical protein